MALRSRKLWHGSFLVFAAIILASVLLAYYGEHLIPHGRDYPCISQTLQIIFGIISCSALVLVPGGIVLYIRWYPTGKRAPVQVTEKTVLVWDIGLLMMPISLLAPWVSWVYIRSEFSSKLLVALLISSVCGIVIPATVWKHGMKGAAQAAAMFWCSQVWLLMLLLRRVL